LKSGEVAAIRISTRPDYISQPILQMLKKQGVQSIELGAQSFDDEVLKQSHRGHTANQTKKAHLYPFVFFFECRQMRFDCF